LAPALDAIDRHRGSVGKRRTVRPGAFRLNLAVERSALDAPVQAADIAAALEAGRDRARNCLAWVVLFALVFARDGQARILRAHSRAAEAIAVGTSVAPRDHLTFCIGDTT